MTAEERLAQVELRSRNNSERLDRLERTAESIHELAQSVAVMAQAQEHLSRDVGEIKEDVQQLKELPARRWEQVIEKVIFGLICTVLGALTAALLRRIGL